jgi:signal transduction histidine kinase
VLITPELARRPRRPPDYQREAEALYNFVQRLTAEPTRAISALADTALHLCRADSAGVSLMETLRDGSEIFRWEALAGRLRCHIGGWTPRTFSPCGISVDRRAPQLLRYPERHFTYLKGVNTPIVDCLVLPFFRNQRPIGAIWILAHSEERKFDREDLRALTRLADVAATAMLLTESSRKAAIAEERTRLMNGLHESMSRSVLTIGYTIDDCLDGVSDDPRLRRKLVAVKRQARGLFASLLNVIWRIEARRPSTRDLVDVVTALVAGFGRLTGIDTHLKIDDSLRHLGPEESSILITTLHEALSNIAKHANAANAWITLDLKGDIVLFDIADDGVGAAALRVTRATSGDGEHFGLRTIYDRITAARGWVRFDARVPTGFRITGQLSASAPGVVAPGRGRVDGA